MMAGGAYFILTKTLIAKHGKDSLLAKAIGKDLKGKISVILYALSIPMAFWFPIVAFLVYILVAVIWIIPDRRIEKEFRHRANKEE